MFRVLAIVVLVLSAAPVLAQPGPGKGSASPGAGNAGPPVGGAGIAPDARSNATKDIPMAGDKSKASKPDAARGHDKARK